MMNLHFNKLVRLFFLTFMLTQGVTAQTINIKTNKPIADIQPTMWGIFFEDINFAADGGYLCRVG